MTQRYTDPVPLQGRRSALIHRHRQRRWLVVLPVLLICLGARVIILERGSHPNTAFKPSAQTVATASAPTSSSGVTKPKAASGGALSTAAARDGTVMLYADPKANVAVQAQAYALSSPSSVVAMNRLATTPMARWFSDTKNSDLTTLVASYVARAAAAGKVPTLVAYNIPERDCGSYSSGGAPSAAAYKTWIDDFSAGIGDRPAIVIVEPDALAGISCLSSADQQVRAQLLTYAVHSLHTQTKAMIYLDAGNAHWQAAATIASRLKAADISEATGFSLNVSNFQTTAASTSYGKSISALVAGKHFIIDTSRNGNGPTTDNATCNPAARAFGSSPTLATSNTLVDAYLWVKSPGESDGICGPAQANTTAPTAGAWWPQYVLMLARNSHW